MTTIFELWRSMAVSEKKVLYVILDSLYEPDAVAHWHMQEWAIQMHPLYYQTPMESILKASPWLCQVAVEKLAEIEQWVDEQQDPTWGWIYISEQPWQQQLTHWQNHLRIMIDGDLRAVRLQDPRVLSIWLSVKDPALWQGLLSPVTVLQLPDHVPESRPHQQVSASSELPWALPTALSDAWYHSPFGIKVAASNFEVALWEQDALLSEQLYEQGGDLEKQLSGWLTAKVEASKPIRTLTIADVMAWANDLLKNTNV
ncbi:DUF4123 domain-containing protein [Vibrio cholerae]|nr:DUF4123 domain-containing protein [Vibrio cholerae]RBO14771.1 DUF4123 domain-containing protein [Vibrio cholerae]